MLHKYLLIPAVLAIGSLLSGPSLSEAAPRGRGGNVSRSANVRSGGTYRGGSYGRGYGGYGRAYGYGGYARGYGYGYGGWWWPGYYYNAYPYPYTYSNPTYDYYAPPAPPYVAAPVPSGTAAIEVIVPDPSARVWFDGTPTRLSGTDRIFQTGTLTSNGTYCIRAAWNVGGREVSQERTVAVTPNQTTVVDFTRPVGG